MVTLRIVTECKGNYLEWFNAVQFGRNVYIIALSYSLSNKVTRRHMLQHCNLHRQRILLPYAQTNLNNSKLRFNINSTKTWIWEPQSIHQIWILTVDCRILQTVANLQTYAVCEYSSLQWICTGSVCWYCKTLPHGGMQINNISYVRISFIPVCLHNHCCSGKATMHSVCVLKLHVTVCCTKTMRVAQKVLIAYLYLLQKYVYWYSYKFDNAVLKQRKVGLCMNFLELQFR